MALSSMGYLYLGQYLCHLTIFFFVTSTFISAAVGKPVQEPLSNDNAFPPLWHLAPGSLKDYPIQDKKIVIDAWNYRERMGMYKILINYSAKYFATPGSRNVGNILWGLPLQHGWQYLTGRLADPRNTTSCDYQDGDNLSISVHSWWACMNYELSVLPFLGALESGFFGNNMPYEIELLPPDENSADFCHSIAECNAEEPDCMSRWRDFFTYLLSFQTSSKSESSLLFSKDEALRLLWHAHVCAIANGLPKCQERLRYYSGPERRFGLDWSNTVDFIAAMRLSTDQTNTNNLQTGLPPRMLEEGDIAPFIRDFTRVQNRVLVLFSIIRNANEITGGGLLQLWKLVTCTEAGRAAGRKIMQIIVNVK